MRDPWQVAVQALKEEGIRFVFGLPGDPRNLYDALYDTPEIRTILVRHETSGVFMAMANARLTGKPGVCFGSPGPGVANLVPGILEAYSACTPLLAFCPTVSTQTYGMGAFQEADQIPMLKPIAKWAIRLENPERMPWLMRRAVSISWNGKPGPVVIEVPSNIGTTKADIEDYKPVRKPLRSRGDPTDIEEAARLILSSKSPILLAGGGVVLSGASKELLELGELLSIPIFTTASGRGSISEEHPLAMGLVGLYRTRVGKEVFESSDLIISVGSRNEEFQSGNWKLKPAEAKFLQIDADPFEIGRNYLPDVAVVGDAKLVLKDIIDKLKSAAQTAKFLDAARVKEITKAKQHYLAEIEAECTSHAERISSKNVVWTLNKLCGHDTILVNENGSQDLWSYYYPYYRVLDAGDCIPPAEQTCMGFGVAAAIGAKLTRPDKKVICTTGDGAFQMFMKELPTAVQYSAPVTWVILNNRSLGWIKAIQKATGGRYIATDFDVQPDFVKIAEANKCHGERIEEQSEIEPAIKEALKANAENVPAVLDFEVDPWSFPEGFKEFHSRIWGLQID
jgi:acetolactate synthase-1/2/3 large subunit